MSKCENCGNELGEKDLFCGVCGTRVAAPQTAEEYKCKKCGATLVGGAKFCKECGEPVDVVVPSTIVQQPVVTPTDSKNYISPEDNNKANMLTAISLVTNIFSSIIAGFLSAFGMNDAFVSAVGGLLPLVSLGLLIYVRIKYPKNVFSKVLLIIYLVLFFGGILLMLLFVFACAIACSTMDTSGCS